LHRLGGDGINVGRRIAMISIATQVICALGVNINIKESHFGQPFVTKNGE
jgi:hypothetical protein